jgi:hypothetical protein
MIWCIECHRDDDAGLVAAAVKNWSDGRFVVTLHSSYQLRPWAIPPWLALVEFLGLTAKEHNKHDDDEQRCR